MSEVRAVCFDAFGTLVEIADKRQPFRTLLREGVKGITADEVLTRPLSLREVAARVSQELGEDGLTELERDLQAECASIRLRPGMATIWQALRARGLRIGVCSNLALPYGGPLLSTLPDPPDAVILSYEVRLVKPDPAIFHLVCNRLGVGPAEILFVGDTPSADFEGPRAIGMPAMLISEFEEHTKRGAHEFGYLFEDLCAAIQGAEYDYGLLETPPNDAGERTPVIKGSGLGPLISLDEGRARLDEIAVDDDRQTGRHPNSSDLTEWRKGLVSRSRYSKGGGMIVRPSPSARTPMSTSTRRVSLIVPDQLRGLIRLLSISRR